MAGLRRNEIDVLPWSAFRWNEGVIRIETTEFYRPKSHNSEGDVRVDPELMEVFRGFYARRKGDFVIESDSSPPPFDAPYGTYRCLQHMRALLGWLRSKGVVSKTPLHTLRKEFGTLIHERYGLLAASEQLRHGDIAVTARHYLENRQPSVLGLGHLLKGERTIIPMDGAADRSHPLKGDRRRRPIEAPAAIHRPATIKDNVAESMGFKGEPRHWEHLLRIGD